MKVIENFTEIERMSMAFRRGVDKSLGDGIGTWFIPKVGKHRACVKNENHRRDSWTVSSLLRLMNDSLDVGMCRYLPLMESTSCLRLLEASASGSSIAARAAVNSRRCVASRLRTASAIA